MITPFEEHLRAAAKRAGLTPGVGSTMFARIPYQDELAVKSEVSQTFLKSFVAPDQLEVVIAAPMPRNYRTTSRRRVWRDARGIRLVQGDSHASNTGDALEQEPHLNVYQRVERSLQARRDEMVAVLNHVIVRGTYEQFVVILNIAEINAEVVRSARKWAQAIVREVPTVTAVWIYVDPKGSRYQLDIERPIFSVTEKKILGDRVWSQEVGGEKYQVGVFSFSQVNLAMAPMLVDVVRRLADVQPTDVLLDLYGGYGLYGAALAKNVKEVITLDSDEATVDNARYNIRRAGGKVRAVATPITAKNISKVVQSADVVIVDPPRLGTDANVIKAVTQLEPRRCVELFCGPDEIRRSIAEWRDNGYVAERIVPMDLFPGTASIEVAIAFVREEQKPKPKQTGPRHRR